MTDYKAAGAAYRRARSRADIARYLEMHTLHMAVYDARSAGLSVREVAALLRVPKTTVARHWKEGHRCSLPIPLWGSEAEYRAAHRMVWAGNDGLLADDFIPFEWVEVDGGREVRCRRRGIAAQQ